MKRPDELGLKNAPPQYVTFALNQIESKLAAGDYTVFGNTLNLKIDLPHPLSEEDCAFIQHLAQAGHWLFCDIYRVAGTQGFTYHIGLVAGVEDND